MAKPAKAENTLQAMEDDMVGAVVRETGFQPSLARIVVLPIIKHLAENYAGERIYVAAPKREYPVAEIIAALEHTGNRDAVCERYGISDRTLYRICEQGKSGNAA